MNKQEYEFRICVSCEARYIEDCECIEIELGTGKPILPKYCWRQDLIKLTPKPHNNAEQK
jgi:hypothetical protein